VHTCPLWLFAALFLAGTAAAAETPPPMLVPDLTGPRLLSLQAGVGAATGTEALFINPAALAARRRYTVDTMFLTDRRPELTGDARQQDYFGGSVMDSSTTRLAAAFAYGRYLKGVETGTLMKLALAAPLARGLFAGLQGNYFDLHGVDRVASAFNLDAGLMYQVSTKVSIGASGYNLLHSDHNELEPQAFGLGVAVGSETSFQLIADWRIDLNRVENPDGSAKKTNRYSVGAEYLFDNSIPLRAGYQLDETSQPTTKWWSAGLGWVSTRLALDLGYRQSVTDPTARTLAIALRVFVPAE
jgi:hypothetical protein